MPATKMPDADAELGDGFAFCSISSSASGGCGSAKTSYQLADEIEADALSALSIAHGIHAIHVMQQRI